MTIISLVMFWNFFHSSASSSVTLSSLSVGSPFSRPASSSLSTALSSRDMQRSAEQGLHGEPTDPTGAPLTSNPLSPSSCKPSTFICTHKKRNSAKCHSSYLVFILSSPSSIFNSSFFLSILFILFYLPSFLLSFILSFFPSFPPILSSFLAAFFHFSLFPSFHISLSS